MGFFKLTVYLAVIIVIASAASKSGHKRPKPNKKGGLKLRLRTLEIMVRTDIQTLKNQMATCNCGIYQANATAGAMDSNADRVAALNATVQSLYADMNDRISAVTLDVQRYGVMLFNLVEMQAGMEDRLFSQLNTTVQEMQSFTTKFASDINQAITALTQASYPRT